ncbi:hypothetical protein BN1723_020937, partial [Verticillium longisporum]
VPRGQQDRRHGVHAY